METQGCQSGRQAGYLLFEVLIALLVFSMGILGIIGLLTSAVQSESDAQNRTEASFLADELIGKMWADHLLAPAALQAKYGGGSGTDGFGYGTWLNDIMDEDEDSSTIAKPRLPGVTAGTNVPVVTIAASALDPATSVVNITLFWQPPGTTDAPHQYTVVTEIK